VFDGRCFVRLDSHVSNTFEEGMRTTLAQRLVSIVSSVFDQACFNRWATHFNISTFGHQTMFDGVKHLSFVQAQTPRHSHDFLWLNLMSY